MNKKLIIRYILLCLPFVIGSLLYCLGVFNIISSMLFFCGGYIALKNMVDYRKIKKNKNIVKIENVISSRNERKYTSSENIIGLKRTRRFPKVRRRIKY